MGTEPPDKAREAQLGFATLDLDRARRRGAPEVIFGIGKTPDQLVTLAKTLSAEAGRALLTRVDDDAVPGLLQLPGSTHHRVARAVTIEHEPAQPIGMGEVCVVTAGTSDLPVAEEAAVTLEFLGHQVRRLTDVGVAGIHRLLSKQHVLDDASVLVVVAGMEGALPSVIAGLTRRPVVAVPTSIGYGVSVGGIAALLGMLSSCAAGITTVNIDNGFGAGYAAHLMNQPFSDPRKQEGPDTPQ